MDAVETIEQDGFTPEPESDDDIVAAGDDPAHLAKCAECSAAVKFRPNVTGTGFFLVDADPDATFGVGEHGRPVCPNGHGEMSIADDQLKPVPEAFADAQAMLLKAEGEAVQAALPGVFPAFNFEAVFKEIVEQAQRVERLKANYDDAKAEATEAKKSLDKAAELLMKMTLEFERRRKEKPETETASEPAPAPVERTPCIWELAHEGAPCPICAKRLSDATIFRILSVFEAAPDAQAHAEDVETLLAGLQVEEIVTALDALDIYVEAGTIAEWSAEDRTAVAAWANLEFDRRHEVPDVVVPERPAVLGKPHVPADAVPGAPQVCTLCDVVLARGTEDNPHYKPTDLIGVDCPGKPNAEPHRYPKKAAKKKAGRARR